MNILIVICLIILIILAVLNLLALIKQGRRDSETNSDEIIALNNQLKEYISEQNRNNRIEINTTLTNSIRNMADIITDSQKASNNNQLQQLSSLEKRMENLSNSNEMRLDKIRETVESRLEYLQSDNNKKLDQMRVIVDEKLQKTIDDKMTRSFALVNERLEQVYKGLGEMQTLAVGVGDLKKVLSNVKTRGILGEIQLGAILKEILSPEQYEENVITKKSSRNPVEFAVKLPNDNNSAVYLPIDSKFPADTYQALLNAQDNGNKDEIATAVKALITRIKSEAKDIHEKYIDPPNTTEFAIMFLPCEGLYAEAVNRGLVEILQREYKVNIAGPSTMAALLNSLQMGFKTLAVQKRSAEVWNVLSSVKTEFDKFEDVLTMTQQRLNQANSELDKLVGVRTRQIKRKLSDVSVINTGADNALLGDNNL
ncbi:MAG: DNA recombination protein RmuC [Acutalibacteraceae bacterium]|nr:DNA recombination protein RmuC [Acutalibacteraceae bacterium]